MLNVIGMEEERIYLNSPILQRHNVDKVEKSTYKQNLLSGALETLMVFFAFIFFSVKVDPGHPIIIRKSDLRIVTVQSWLYIVLLKRART